MALTRAHTSSKAADPELSLLNKRLVKTTQRRGVWLAPPHRNQAQP